MTSQTRWRKSGDGCNNIGAAPAAKPSKRWRSYKGILRVHRVRMQPNTRATTNSYSGAAKSKQMSMLAPRKTTAPVQGGTAQLTSQSVSITSRICLWLREVHGANARTPAMWSKSAARSCQSVSFRNVNKSGRRKFSVSLRPKKTHSLIMVDNRDLLINEEWGVCWATSGCASKN